MTRLTDRFLEYVKHDTTADPNSHDSPSSSCQMDFLRLLKGQLEGMGMEDVELDPAGTLYAGLPGDGVGDVTIGLLAHVDTSPDAPGKDVNPRLHVDWDGEPIVLQEDVVIDPVDTDDMPRYKGGTIITSDGTTLLGADDKAGVALIMEVCSTLTGAPSIPRPPLRIAFTTDEEVGRGVDGFDTGRFGAELAYTVDGGMVGKVDTQTFNAWSATWKVRGREVHPGSARGSMVSAVRIVADIISGIPPEEMPENSSGTEGYDYPMSVKAVTSAGEVRMILRDFTDAGMRARLDRVEQLRDWIRTRHPGAVIDLELKEQYSNPASILEKDRRAVDFALEAVRRCGLEGEEGSIRGGTDGSRLSFMGVPTVNLPTGGEMYHSRREWIAVEGLETSYRTLLETLKIWGGN